MEHLIEWPRDAQTPGAVAEHLNGGADMGESNCSITGCETRRKYRYLCAKHWRQAWIADPETRAAQSEWTRIYQSSPEFRARRTERRAKLKMDPDVRARATERERKRLADPETRARRAELRRAREQIPEIRERKLQRITSDVYRAVQRARNARCKFGESVPWRVMDAIAQQSCFDCGVVPAGGVDHVIPFIRGGRNVIENLQPACLSCNKKKGMR